MASGAFDQGFKSLGKSSGSNARAHYACARDGTLLHAWLVPVCRRWLDCGMERDCSHQVAALPAPDLYRRRRAPMEILVCSEDAVFGGLMGPAFASWLFAENVLGHLQPGDIGESGRE